MPESSSKVIGNPPSERLVQPPALPHTRDETDCNESDEAVAASDTSLGTDTGDKPDPIQQLRELTINALIPTFIELVRKYADSGIFMLMDASSLLEGGREIHFEFAIGAHRSHLQGTVTPEAIAFHETRQRPDVKADVVSAPMLRLRGLNDLTFREFVCERLVSLIRSSLRRH